MAGIANGRFARTRWNASRRQRVGQERPALAGDHCEEEGGAGHGAAAIVGHIRECNSPPAREEERSRTRGRVRRGDAPSGFRTGKRYVVCPEGRR